MSDNIKVAIVGNTKRLTSAIVHELNRINSNSIIVIEDELPKRIEYKIELHELPELINYLELSQRKSKRKRNLKALRRLK
jgi:hypothetical protein